MRNSLREQKIINILLVFCLAAGFICFSFILLPNKFKKTGSLLKNEPAASPQNISEIVKLDSDEPKHGSTNLKSPYSISPQHDNETSSITADTRQISSRDLSEPVGGAGAAIDEASFEAAESYIFNRERREDMQDKTAFLSSAIPKSQETDVPKRRSYPPSSIANNEQSVFDNTKSLHEKSWLVTPEGLEADVAFWRDIYAKYDGNQAVLHHPRYLKIVYDVVDVADIKKDPRLTEIEKQHLRQKRIDERKKRITDILLKLASGAKGEQLNDAEWRIKQLFHGIDEPEVFRRAAIDDGVRSQIGQRDKFIAGLKYSGRYLGEIESIFASYGLPRELTRIIFVESMFNPAALSSVGASGIWQFMRQTGKLYMRINDLIDERNDPIAATHAAAKLFRHNYEYLGSWPLAINAYNTGRGRIQEAATRLGTNDIGAIIKKFNHPAYGFASRNFFLEFLAALDVAEHAEKYFGPIEWAEPIRYETLLTHYNISLPAVAHAAGIPLDQILELNPGFTQKVSSGEMLIPIGFTLKIPQGKTELFLAAQARSPASRLGPIHHVVEEGESLLTVADFYGVTQTSIIASNNLISRKLRAGQTIVVPVDKKR